MNQGGMMNKYVSILDGHNLRFCIKCNFVWEGPWDKRDGVTIIKYSNLSSYRLKRKQCLKCEREINGKKTNIYIRGKRLVTKYY